MWICPDCGRKFSRDNQSHSCLEYNLDDMFIGKDPKTRDLFDYLMVQVTAFGESAVYTAKFNITLRRLSTFAAIMVEKTHLTIVFISREPIDEFPVHQTHQHSQNRSSNVIKVESIEEIDDQLIRWLRAAWEMAV